MALQPHKKEELRKYRQQRETNAINLAEHTDQQIRNNAQERLNFIFPIYIFNEIKRMV